jgi:phenylpropionate dioxygenase-like ring-hydroxylating dioxygenase large terminal subunit
MYINFWYAMEESKNVSGERPLRVRRLNQDFVMWRDQDGRAHCLHDVCTHRGGSLAGGTVRSGCVQCPYHGWRFQGSGDCEYIPSMGKDHQKIPERSRVDSYPTQEHRGVIFAFLGDLPEEERPPLMHSGDNPRKQDYSGPKWRSTALGWDIHTNYERCMENGLDPSHNEFVHPSHGYGGKNLDDYYVPAYDVEHHPWGQGFMVDAPSLFVPLLQIAPVLHHAFIRGHHHFELHGVGCGDGHQLIQHFDILFGDVRVHGIDVGIGCVCVNEVDQADVDGVRLGGIKVNTEIAQLVVARGHAP